MGVPPVGWTVFAFFRLARSKYDEPEARSTGLQAIQAVLNLTDTPVQFKHKIKVLEVSS